MRHQHYHCWYLTKYAVVGVLTSNNITLAVVGKIPITQTIHTHVTAL